MRKLVIITSLALVIVLAFTAMVTPALAGGGKPTPTPTPDPITTSGVTPVYYPGNPSCSDIGVCGFNSIKFDTPLNGIHNPDGTITTIMEDGHGQTITVTVSQDGRHFSWTSIEPVSLVIVKGGNNAYVYFYSPNSHGDGELRAPGNHGGQIPQLSHIEFCYDDFSAPTPEASTIILILLGIAALGGFVLISMRHRKATA